MALAIAHWDKDERPLAQQGYRQAISLDSGYGNRTFLAHLKKAGFSPAQIKATEQVLAAAK